MKSKALHTLVLAAMFFALGLTLPFLTGQIKQIGNMLLPMHFPVMLCGLICGPWYGLAVGLTLPVIRSLLFTMPVMYPTALAMSAELATYGLVVGLLFLRTGRKSTLSLYRALIGAMVCGRVVWGIVSAALIGVGGSRFTFGAFFAGAVLNALPGILLQLILIPAVMLLLDKTRLVPMNAYGEKKN